jgi:YD repeat-containing protein
LPVVEIRHELPAEQRACPTCGGELMEMTGQTEDAERITTIKLTHQVEHHRRQNYRCACNAAVVTAPGRASHARCALCAGIRRQRGRRERRRSSAAQAPGAYDGPSIADPRPGASQSFAIDALDRLSVANGPWGSLTWTYDASGNRLSETGAAGLTTYTYGTGTQQLYATEGVHWESFGYDPAGRLTGMSR